jgi:hypothetical protein
MAKDHMVSGATTLKPTNGHPNKGVWELTPPGPDKRYQRMEIHIDPSLGPDTMVLASWDYVPGIGFVFNWVKRVSNGGQD